MMAGSVQHTQPANSFPSALLDAQRMIFVNAGPVRTGKMPTLRDRQYQYMDVTGHNVEGKWRKVGTLPVRILREDRPDGSILLRSEFGLEDCPYRLTERLVYWANQAPDRIFLGRRNREGGWETLNYSETLTRVERIAQSLLDRKLSPDSPLAILSGNSIEHALLALAAMHIGLPYSAIAPAYSLKSNDFTRLTHVTRLLSPGLLFVGDVEKYEAALHAIGGGSEIISLSAGTTRTRTTPFETLMSSLPTTAVSEAYLAIRPETVAKVLFTSGSTGLPKGVINTHGNISANWQQITQTFPFLKEKGLEFIDWLPWNHTFGGNHNFGMALFNGGSFYIDDGTPTPEGILTTVSNLKERRPTIYFNVPRGFEALLPFFKRDSQLGRHFFSELKMLFYAGAGMPQHVWDQWDALSQKYAGEKILITTGLGSTESCPSALFGTQPDGFAGLVGTPVPGLELKLAPMGDKLEARYRGPNIFPGYWKQPDLTQQAFDDEGFYCTGDSLRFADKSDAGRGMVFDGRLAEEFKLSTGTWVSVGSLRSQLLAAGGGLIKEAVITGHDRNFVGAILFLSMDRRNPALDNASMATVVSRHEDVRKALQDILHGLALRSTGSANLIQRVLVADFEPSSARGELTEKGSVNQKRMLQNHPDLIERLYQDPPDGEVLTVRPGIE